MTGSLTSTTSSSPKSDRTSNSSQGSPFREGLKSPSKREGKGRGINKRERSIEKEKQHGEQRSSGERRVGIESEQEIVGVEEPKPTYITICTSDDRLELTVTPTALCTIQLYIEVNPY